MFFRKSLFGRSLTRGNKKNDTESRRRSWLGFSRSMAVEPLEERTLLTVSADLTGDFATFTDVNNDGDFLELRLGVDGDLEWQIDFGGFTDDLNTAAPGVQNR